MHRVLSRFKGNDYLRAMIRYSMVNGITIYATGASDFLRKLRIASHHLGIGDGEFMELFSSRMEQSNGTVLRTANAGEFLADLLAYGFCSAAILTRHENTR